MTSTFAYDWTELRKQARSLENEIDAKLVALNNLGINATSNDSSSESVPLLDEEHVFDNMSIEIESLLSKLNAVNEKMSEYLSNHEHTPVLLVTTKRHKETLNDYKLDFNKTKNNFTTKRDRENLLGKSSREQNFKSMDGVNRREMYMKENQHIYNSNRLINDQISIAMETRDNLMSQRHVFQRVQTRFNDISNQFPAINSLVQRVNVRKRRNSLILGLLISFCTFLILLYTFH